MSDKFEIQFRSKVIPAKALMVVKEATGLSLSEIKCSAQNGSPFFGCDLSDDVNLDKIIKIYESLDALGVETLLLDEGNVEAIDYFRNVLDSHKDTAREVGLDEDFI